MGGGEAGVLGFAARHQLVLGAQIRAFLQLTETAEREAVSRLVCGGDLERVRLLPDLDAFAVSAAGLAAAGCEAAPSTRVDRELRRAIGAVWVWMRAGDGRFPGATVLSERELLTHDLAAAASDASPRSKPSPRYGLRIGGVRSPRETGLHYPDMLVKLRDGWCAVHLQLGPVGNEELQALLRSYGTDERYGRVVFLVERERVGEQVETAAVSVGVSAMTSVQWMEWPQP